MKNQLLFIQGGGANVHDEWDDKLVASLERTLGRGWDIRYPRMPSEDDPHYAAWKPAIEREIAALDDGAILVGHSLGGTMLVNALADQPPEREIGAVVLIAPPFVGQGGWPGEEFATPANLGERLPAEAPVHIFHGDADETAPPAHADLYARAVPQAKVHRLPGRDHQLNNDLAEVAEVIESLA
jgi:predicted alpha/beta hydrolase family esterase